MTPQSAFLVIGAVAAGREAALRALLETMNREPGVANPDNPLLPFGRFERLHFVRLVVLDETGMADLSLYRVPPPRLGLRLVLLGDCDGPARRQLDEFAELAGDGMRLLFGHCEDFDQDTDLRAWLRKHSVPTQANYVNYRGRTARQVREERALQRFLSAKVVREGLTTGAQEVRSDLLAQVQAEIRGGRLSLSPPEPTPWPGGWRIWHTLPACLCWLCCFCR